MSHIRKLYYTIVKLFGVRDTTFGAKRSPKWRQVRRDFLSSHPVCAVCGRKKKLFRSLQVHHIVPFHRNQSLECEQSNLITLCPRCHLLVGHLNYFGSFNEDVRQDADYLFKKIKTRP